MADFINTIDVLGDDAVVDSIIDRTITELKDNAVNQIGAYAFANCASLVEVNLPNVVTAGSNAFNGCKNLAVISLPELTTIDGTDFFKNCASLKKIYLPKVTSSPAANGCPIEVVYLPMCNGIGYGHYGTSTLKLCAIGNGKIGGSYGFAGWALVGASALKVMVVATSTVTELVTNLSGTPYAEGGSGGYVIVPSNLIESYKAATNWSKFYAYGTMTFLPLEDYTVDGTVTGKLAFCTSVDVDAKELVFTEPGTKCLTPIVTPTNAVDALGMEWSTDNPRIVSVKDGVVTTKYNGTTTVTVTCGEHSASCVVKISGHTSFPNILEGVAFYNGTVNASGTILTSATNVYTDKFYIGDLADTTINVVLEGTLTAQNDCAVLYFTKEGKIAGYKYGTKGNSTITSLVPTNAYDARVVVNMTGGFTGFTISSGGTTIGTLDYTA